MASHPKKTATVGLLLVSACVLGVVAGVIIGAVSSYSYVVVVYPALGGLACAFTLSRLTHTFKVHSDRMGPVVTTLMSLSLIVASLMTTFALERSRVTAELHRTGHLSEQTVIKKQAEWEGNATGNHQDLSAPLFYRLHSGARLTRSVVIDLPTPVNGAILFIELVLVFWLGNRLISKEMGKPYCTACNRWYVRKNLGGTALGSLASIRSAMESQRFHRLGRLLSRPEESAKHPVNVQASYCEVCREGTVYYHVSARESGRRSRLVHQSQSDVTTLSALMDSQDLKAKVQHRSVAS